MKIRTKILWTLVGMSLLVALVGALAVNRQKAAAVVGATKEAQDVAALVSFLLMSDANKLSVPALQEIVTRLHEKEGRDVVLMDANQRILADAVPAEIGTVYANDPGDEAGATIHDRQVRTFIEVSPAYPAGIRQIVVPVEGESGQVIGAVVLEYTPIYNELMALTNGTIWQVTSAALGSMAVALLIALYMGRSIARPLRLLATAATGFASGRTDLPLPLPQQDEMGELATAFRSMMGKRQQAEAELQCLTDDLEIRVVERTRELAQANEALQVENTERKHAEIALRESDEKFRQLADHITDAFWIRSPDMQQVHYISPAFEKIWGRSVESLYAHPHQWSDFILPEDRERVLGAFAALTGDVPHLDLEYRIVRPEGEIRWVRVRGFQVRNAGNELVRHTGIVTDITERKQAEEELRWKTAFLEAQLISSLDGILVVNADGRKVLQNQRTTDLFKIPAAIADENDDAPQLKWVANAVKNPEKFVERVAFLYAHPDEISRDEIELNDGTVLDRCSAPVIGAEREYYGRIWTFRDITERKRGETALLESKRFLRSTIDALTSHIAILDEHGAIVEVNETWNRFAGENDLVGGPCGVGENYLRVCDAASGNFSKEAPEMARGIRAVITRERDEFHIEYPCHSPREKRWFIARVTRFGGDGPVRVVVAHENITKRKRAEEALRESEDRLRAAISASGTGTFRWDFRSNELSWDDSLHALFGLPPGQTVRSLENFIAALHPNDRPGVLEGCERCAREGADFSMEFRVLWPDGSLHWLDDKGKTFFDDDGQPLYMTGASVDITERKLTEAMFMDSQQRLGLATESANIGIWDWNVVTNELLWDAKMYALYGLREADFSGAYDAWQRSLHPEDRARAEAEIMTAVHGVGGFHTEFRVLWPNGEVRYIEAHAVVEHAADGSTVRMVGVNRDITEHRLAESALRESEAEFRSLAEAMPQMVWITRPDGWNIYFSQQWMEYTGLTMEESLGHGWSKPFHPDDQPRARDAWQHATATHGHYSIDCRLRRADGVYRWWLMRAVPQQDASGHVLKWFGTCTDIHDMKLAELEISRAKQEIEQLNADLERRVEQRTESLLAATAEAERANRAKSEFLSRMSHELRTPMNAILGFAQVLELEDGLTGDQRDSVHQILKGGTHLLALVNEVLDITTIDAGRMTISTEPVALQDLLAESVGLLQPLAAELKVRLAVMPGEVEGQHVLADWQRLKQVLLNLLANAIKYNRPRGSVTVRCAALPQADGRSGTAIRLSITDTGPGLSANQLARLFNPFERLGAEQTRVEGTGLGLMLAKRMVERMGGTIGVESVVGEGSTFWIELCPAEAPSEGHEEQALESVLLVPPEAPAARRTLLYIEDNPANVRLISRILARRPAIEMLCAETGALGLEMARKCRPDLILLDLHLPDSHGDEVLAQLRADPPTAQIPVIMLTADVQPGKRDQLVAAGARAFLAKPVIVRTFLATIDQFIAV